MKTYKIYYEEVVCYEFEVEANSEEEAIEEFHNPSNFGSLDFSNGLICDSNICVEEVV